MDSHVKCSSQLLELPCRGGGLFATWAAGCKGRRYQALRLLLFEQIEEPFVSTPSFKKFMFIVWLGNDFSIPSLTAESCMASSSSSVTPAPEDFPSCLDPLLGCFTILPGAKLRQVLASTPYRDQRPVRSETFFHTFSQPWWRTKQAEAELVNDHMCVF